MCYILSLLWQKIPEKKQLRGSNYFSLQIQWTWWLGVTIVDARSSQSQKHRVSRKWDGTIEPIDPLPPTRFASPGGSTTFPKSSTNWRQCSNTWAYGEYFIFNTLKHRPAAVSPVFKHCRQDKMTKDSSKLKIFHMLLFLLEGRGSSYKCKIEKMYL